MAGRADVAAALSEQRRKQMEHQTSAPGMPFGGIKERGNVLPFGQDEYGRNVFAQPQMFRDLVDAVTLPGDVLAGRREPSIPDVTNLAMALTVGASGGSAPAGALRSGAARRAANESVDDVAARGEAILQMLKNGRGQEVTDAMLDMGDPVKTAKLNAYLYNNYDLPMDYKSRLQRSKENFRQMPLYHGTAADFSGFNPKMAGGNTNNLAAKSASLYAADRPQVAAEFAEMAARGNEGKGQVLLPLVHAAKRGAALDLDGSETNLEIAATLREAFDGGLDGVMLRNYTTPSGAPGGNVVAVPRPEQVRSIFARFDPRLSHLRNLNAGLAGAAVAGAATGMGGGDARADDALAAAMEDYIRRQQNGNR